MFSNTINFYSNYWDRPTADVYSLITPHFSLFVVLDFILFIQQHYMNTKELNTNGKLLSQIKLNSFSPGLALVSKAHKSVAQRISVQNRIFSVASSACVCGGRCGVDVALARSNQCLHGVAEEESVVLRDL